LVASSSRRARFSPNGGFAAAGRNESVRVGVPSHLVAGTMGFLVRAKVLRR
jgi:hypothetical protein